MRLFRPYAASLLTSSGFPSHLELSPDITQRLTDLIRKGDAQLLEAEIWNKRTPEEYERLVAQSLLPCGGLHSLVKRYRKEVIAWTEEARQKIAAHKTQRAPGHPSLPPRPRVALSNFLVMPALCLVVLKQLATPLPKLVKQEYVFPVQMWRYSIGWIVRKIDPRHLPDYAFEHIQEDYVMRFACRFDVSCPSLCVLLTRSAFTT